MIFLLCVLPIKAAALENVKAGAVVTAGGSLNVRSQPSAAAPVEALLKKGSYVTLHERNGDWWRVEYEKGRYGFCHADYIAVVQGTAVSVKTRGGNLNVRSGPGLQYAKAASLYPGGTILFLREEGQWSRVLYHGRKTGYVSSRYLSGYYEPVSLSVPSLKQNDSRWADKPVGSSGKPFSQIGCATTAVAMMESFRQGRTIRPDVLSEDLRYTSAGDLYWPDHFKADTVSAGYLQRIYGVLAQGKPVLLGMKNAAGGQHWVVVTGYRGGMVLNAEGFSINDPGSVTRTNLEQLMASHPVFYKFFTY